MEETSLKLNMEQSSEGMDVESNLSCEDISKDIDALAQLEGCSDAAKTTLEQNSVIVNKTPSSSSTNLNQSHKTGNTIPPNLNVDKPNPIGLVILQLIKPSYSNKISTNTSILNPQHLAMEALELSTNSSNNLMAASNKNTYSLTANYFQQFNNIELNPLPSTTDQPKRSHIHQCDETTTDSVDNLAIAIDHGQPASGLEFLQQAIANTNNFSQTITKDKRKENSAKEEYVEEDLFLPTKPTNKSENESDPSKIRLFGEDKGPHWHEVTSPLVTPPIITENLSKIFADFPIFGKPENQDDRENFLDGTVRKFVGCDLDDGMYAELKEYCSVENLKIGKELILPSKIPTLGLIHGPPELEEEGNKEDDTEEPTLFVLRKLKTRMDLDDHVAFTKKLKYRGCRIMPMCVEDQHYNIPSTEPPDLDPGQDVLYRVRVYRPFTFMTSRHKCHVHMRGRRSVFACDMYVLGRQPLWALRDRLACRNDADLRLDVSHNPDLRPHTTAKDVFPSGFLFINNVFYVDRRARCRDLSAVVRRWAAERGLGRFPMRDMAMPLRDVAVRLAHPEVYVHQGNCEHVFLFSEIRLLSFDDPLHLSCYPCHTAFSQNQTIYCTTCADFGAKWIVTGCDRIPFDPGFFCDGCFRQYLYKSRRKIGEFKAYSYKGNELSLLKH